MNDPYISSEYAEDRLYQDYKKHSTLIIGVDFDNTIFDCHNKGFKFPRLIRLIKSCQEMEFSLCLFTCSENTSKMTDFENENDIKFSMINASQAPTKTSKPYFNILLDDRAGLGESVRILEKVIERIKSE